MIEKVENLMKNGEDVQAYLSNEIDFDIVSPALSNLNLKRNDILNLNPLSCLHSSMPLTNQVVKDLDLFRRKEGLPNTTTAKWVKFLSGDNNISDRAAVCAVDKTLTKYNKCLKERSKNEQKAKLFEIFCEERFQFEARTQKPMKEHSKSATHEQCEYQNNPMKVQSTNITPEQSQLMEEIRSLKEAAVEIGKMRNDALKSLEEANKDKKTLKEKIEKQKNKLRKCRVSYVTRLESRINTLKKNRNTLNRENAKLKNEIHNCECTKKTLERSLRRQKAKLKEQEQHLQKLQQQLDFKLQTQSESTMNTRIPEEGNRYNDDVRKTVITLQSEGVPATKVENVIRSVAKNLFHKNVGELPKRQTVTNIFSNEGTILSNIQVAEKVVESEHVTLHTDGTSKDHRKYVGQQLTLSSGEELSLGFQLVAQEDACTLLDISIANLDQLAEIYSKHEETEKSEVFRIILGKITSLMSDRAAVMKKFDREFETFMKTELGHDIQIHFLFCNAHFMLGLSRASETALKALELGHEEKLGRDKFMKFKIFTSVGSCAARLVRMTCELTGPRGDEKNGCRSDWEAFLEDKDSIMTCYRYVFYLILKGYATPNIYSMIFLLYLLSWMT